MPPVSSSVLASVVPGARHSEAEPRILVAYASGVLAAAISRRLALHADVDLVPAREVSRRLRGGDTYDAVVICPYLTEREWARVRDSVASCVADEVGARPPVLVDIREAIGHIETDVEDWGRPERTAALRPIIEALAT
jgi:hypothetical protein